MHHRFLMSFTKQTRCVAAIATSSVSCGSALSYDIVTAKLKPFPIILLLSGNQGFQGSTAHMNRHPELDSINVLIVDDHPIIREGLRKLLETEPDIVIVAEAATGQSALETARHLQPDVVLLDINLPDVNGIEVTSKLKAERSHVAVVLLTAYDDKEQVLHAMRAGASAYAPKDIEPEKLVAVIRQVARGNYVIDGKVFNERG